MKKEPPKWIEIKDKEPEDGEIVLGFFEHTGVDIMKCHHLKGDAKMFGRLMFTSPLGFLTDDVTHWIPLGKRLQEVMDKLWKKK